MLRNITDAYKETLTLLQLEAFPAAVALFRFKGRKGIALNIAETLLENGVMVPSVEQVSPCGLGIFGLFPLPSSPPSSTD